MFAFLLLLGMAATTSLYKNINPKQLLTFYEEISEDKQYSELTITRLTQADTLYYRIIPERRDADDTSLDSDEMDVLEHPLERNVNERLERPGLWKIEVYNRGDEVEKFAISIYSVMKMQKGNEDVQALRNLLTQVQATVETLRNENQYANTTQAANTKSAEKLNFYLNLMCLLPFLVFLIAQVESSLARQIVRPKMKRFKWLFGQGR